MDDELRKIAGKEISEELLLQMNITTIEQYNNYIKDDMSSNNKSKMNQKNKDKKNKISNSKIKMEQRKKTMVMEKKRKNEMRSKILESLEKHNKEEAVLLEQMDSMKNLGKKRKKSKDEKENIKDEMNNNNEDEELDYDEEIKNNIEDNFSDSEISEESENNRLDLNRDNNRKEIQINPQSINEINTNSELRINILQEIKSHREKEGLLLDIDENETDSTVDSTMSLSIQQFIPDKLNIQIVNRVESIQNERINLPIVKYEHEIMDKINNSLVTVVCGETGSGKSTQIPQFLYEYGYTSALGGIVITQPRRVAAISLATRVSQELNTRLGDEVGYQVRHDARHYSDSTVIKYVTDGILLKELESDKLLLKYSVVIIDEAHERTINTDIIIGLLSKLVKIRYQLAKNKIRLKDSNLSDDFYVKPLRLVIMSATMRVDEFLNSQIFKPNLSISFIKIEARQFPVTVHHAKRTLDDYQEETFKLVCKIHNKLPPGGVLVFMTGKREILDMCRRLTEEFEKKGNNEEITLDEDEMNIDKNIKINENNIINNEVNDNGNVIENVIENTDLLTNEDIDLPNTISYKPYLILPLFSSLPQDQQLKIFDTLPADKRLIIISTNVAETSLTIPGIRYVVDTGRAKKRVFKTGLSSYSEFKIEWISQASAEQRTGRAGRTGPGYCYRLFSNGLFAKMEKYTEPQIVSSPLDQMILYLKSLNIKDISKFPFLTFPKRVFVEKTMRHLLVIGALKTDEDSEYNLVKNYINMKKDEEVVDYKDNTDITEVGKLMVKFPVPPRYAKMIILGKRMEVLEYVLVLVSVMNTENIIDNYSEKQIESNLDSNIVQENITNINPEIKNKNKSSLSTLLDTKLLNPFSDQISQMNLILTLLKTDYNKNHILNSFCKKYHLNIKKVREMIDILEQLLKICKFVFNVEIDFKSININIPDSNSQTILMQILLSGFIDNIARRKIIYDEVGNEKEFKNNTSNSVRRIVYECNENNEVCQIHPHSLINKNNPDLIIYKEIIKENKTFITMNTIIKPEWIYNLGGELVTFNLIKDSALNEPFYNKIEDNIFCFVNIKYGYKNWEIPRVRVEMNREDENYLRYFARFLLEGKIYKEFQEYERFLNSKPNLITNQISLLPKVTMLVNSLKFSKIKSREDLIKMWKNKKSFLLDVYLNWIDDIKIKERIRIKWPLINLLKINK